MQLTTSGKIAKTMGMVGAATALATATAPVQSNAQDTPNGVEGHYFTWSQTGGDGLATYNGDEDVTIDEPMAVANYTLGKRWSFNLKADVDIMSVASESADEIDSASGSSGYDRRTQQNFTISYTPTDDLSGDRNTFSMGAGSSNEYDYKSNSVTLASTHEFLDRNFVLAFALSFLNDEVASYRITEDADASDGTKDTTNFAVSATQVLTRRSLINFGFQYTKQEGLLSRPLNSVAVRAGPRQQERLPDSRSRFALRTQYNHFFGETTAAQVSYRFYSDDWQVNAHTLKVRVFQELFDVLELGYTLRYHTQTEVEWWGESFAGDEQYVTSDSDLEGLSSLYNALDLSWELPSVLGLDPRIAGFVGSYTRSNGLQGTTAGASLIVNF